MTFAVDWVYKNHLSIYTLVYSQAVLIAAGILGLAGATIFGIQSVDDATFNTPAADLLPHRHEDHHSDLQWGFGLAITASIIALLSAAAIGYSRCTHAQPSGAAKMTPVPGTAFADEGSVLFRDDGHEADSSSMMLVPAGHFDTKRSPRLKSWGRADPPPPYALPPPYPYSPNNCDFFHPIANSSMVPHIAAGSSTFAESTDTDNAADQSPSSFPSSGTGGLTATPTQSFPSPIAAYITHHRPMMRPLFVKTSEGGSEVEITPSAQNSSGLPSPFNRF